MKNTMKKIFALAMTAVMSVGIFAGCGGEKGGETNSDKIKITVSVSGTDASEGTLMQKWKLAIEVKVSCLFRLLGFKIM